MKVSIIITNYNYEKYLNRCIRSCLNQDYSIDGEDYIIMSINEVMSIVKENE